MSAHLSSYRWRATYNDGFTLTEEPGNPVTQYRNIDRSKLRRFELLRADSHRSVFSMAFEPHQRLIWRRRFAQRLGGQHEIVHIIGKQWTRDGQNHQAIALFFEKDGTVEMFDRFDETHPFLQGVQFLPCENNY